MMTPGTGHCQAEGYGDQRMGSLGSTGSGGMDGGDGTEIP